MKTQYIKNKKDIDELMLFFDEVFGELTEIHEDTSLRHKNIMLEELKNNNAHCIYIKDNGKIVAGLSSWYISNFNSLLIDLLAVEKDYRNKHIASNLLNDLYETAKKENIKYLQVAPEKENYGFYMKNGFIPVLNVCGIIRNLEIDEIRKTNIYDFEEFKYRADIIKNGVDINIEYIVDFPKDEYINYFNKALFNEFSPRSYYYFIKKIY